MGSMTEESFPEVNFELVIKENEKHGIGEQNFLHWDILLIFKN